MREVGANHEVSVVSLGDPDDDVASSVRATRQYCRGAVRVAGSRRCATGGKKRILQLATMGSPWSYEHVAYQAGALQVALDELLSRERFDVVQFEFAQMAGYRTSSARNRPVLVLDEHNIEFDVERRTAGAAVGALRRVYSAVNWRKLRREERAAWRRFDGCVLTSARDRQMLAADQPGLTSCVVPNGVDVEEFAPDANRAATADTILFFGAINYHPNTEGVLFFLREVWPIVKAQRPGVRFRVVGPGAPPIIAGWPDPAVEVTGYVDDIRVPIGAASVVVVPLRIGGGTRLKVIEAMGLGKALVSTTLGAEGIDVTHERDVLIADTPADFARQVLRVLDDGGLARRLGAEARRLAVSRYSWRAASERLLEFYRELGATG
jgi:glycosyltransferase involved in cell wall biosynthesis